MVLSDPSEYGLVFGSKNKVMAWHIDLDEPAVLAKREPLNRFGGHVNSIVFHKGKLYDAGYNGLVMETIENKDSDSHSLGEISKNAFHSPIFGLGSYNGRLIAVRHVEIEGNHSSFARLHYVDNNEKIVDFNYDNREIGLMYRPHSLDLKVTDSGRIYVASENVVKVTPKANGEVKIDKLTGYMADFITLASEGNKIYSMHHHNHFTDPNGTEIRKIPSNKRIAFWKPTEDWGGLNEQKSYGFSQMFSVFGDSFIVGMTDRNDKECNFCIVNVTKEMNSSERGARATPLALSKNSYESPEVYGEGNPLLVLPRKTLDEILSQ